MNSKTNTVRAILLDASECDRPEADHPATIEICADDLQRILERHITEPAQCLHQIAEPAAVHPDDVAVDALAALMKAKLAKQRGKGYSGWDTDCTQEHLSNLLRSHVNKGDPVDVANFCAFLAARGEMICLTDAELINAMETRRAAEPQRLLAATQPAAQPVATITGLDEFGPLLGWHEHWAKFPVGTNFYTQPAAQGLDAEMLNFINDKRVALTPEYEGPWKAEVFGDEAEPVITTEGNTVRDAVSAAIAAQAKQGGAA